MKQTSISEVSAFITQLSFSGCPANTIKNIRFLKPYHLALLAIKFAPLKPPFDINVLSLGHEKCQYAARMKLFKHILPSGTLQSHENDPTGRFIPLAQIKLVKDAFDHAKKATDILFSYACAKEFNRSKESIKTAIIEIINNCLDHAFRTKLNLGFVTGQVWANGNLAQICIADNGVGVRESLSKNPLIQTRLANENSCFLASQYGVTSGGRHTGYGLNIISELMKQIKGRLIILSYDEYCYFDGQSISCARLITPFAGTVIMFEWNIGQKLEILKVYDSFDVDDSEINLDTI